MRSKEADIEGDVVGNKYHFTVSQRVVMNDLKELLHRWCIMDILIGDAMNTRGPRRDRTLRVNQTVKSFSL